MATLDASPRPPASCQPLPLPGPCLYLRQAWLSLALLTPHQQASRPLEASWALESCRRARGRMQSKGQEENEQGRPAPHGPPREARGSRQQEVGPSPAAPTGGLNPPILRLPSPSRSAPAPWALFLLWLQLIHKRHVS